MKERYKVLNQSENRLRNRNQQNFLTTVKLKSNRWNPVIGKNTQSFVGENCGREISSVRSLFRADPHSARPVYAGDRAAASPSRFLVEKSMILAIERDLRVQNA